MKSFWSCRLTCFVLILVLLGCGEKKQDKLLPSEVHYYVFDSVMTLVQEGEITNREEFSSARNRIAEGLIHRCRTDTSNMDSEEILKYGKLFHWTGNTERATDILKNLSDADDALALDAMRTIITMKIETGDYPAAEEMMADFRDRFPVTPENEDYLYQPVEELSGRYNNRNMPEEAARVIIDELDAMRFDFPYPSYYMVGELLSLMIELNRLEECMKLMGRIRNGFKQSLSVHADTMVYSDSLKKEDDSLLEGLKRLDAFYQSAMGKLELIDQEAPPLEFIHVYNADSTLTFSDLEGEVVVLDFWATWCVPCVVGFNEMRKLKEEFGDEDLKIVGVTSLQGRFPGYCTARGKDGTPVKMSPDKEIRLTSDYIKDHRMDWPCVILKDPLFDLDYQIKSIPTCVVIDRNMKIRFFHAGIGAYPQLNRVVSGIMEGEV